MTTLMLFTVVSMLITGWQLVSNYRLRREIAGLEMRYSIALNQLSYVREELARK